MSPVLYNYLYKSLEKDTSVETTAIQHNEYRRNVTKIDDMRESKQWQQKRNVFYSRFSIKNNQKRIIQHQNIIYFFNIIIIIIM
jgi:hypothetical protein